MEESFSKMGTTKPRNRDIWQENSRKKKRREQKSDRRTVKSSQPSDTKS